MELKKTEVWVTLAEKGSGVYYDLLRMEEREQIELKSLYTFTEEELRELLNKTWLAALNYEIGTGRVEPNLKTFINNLFKPTTNE